MHRTVSAQLLSQMIKQNEGPLSLTPVYAAAVSALFEGFST